jgi:hypothetical protein
MYGGVGGAEPRGSPYPDQSSFRDVATSSGSLPLMARNGHADCIAGCPLSGAKRKTYAKRRETGKE